MSDTNKNEYTSTKSSFFCSINDDRLGGFLIWFQHLPAIAIGFVDNHSWLRLLGNLHILIQ